MTSFVVYDAEGKILKTGVCQEGDLHLQARDGQSVLVGVADDLTQMVVDGVVVDKPDPSDDEKRQETITEVRRLRDMLLNLSDWTQVADSQLTDEQRSDWRVYRQKLRDLPSDYADATSLEDVVFPDDP